MISLSSISSVSILSFIFMLAKLFNGYGEPEIIEAVEYPASEFKNGCLPTTAGLSTLPSVA
jgi:hypothetical protein